MKLDFTSGARKSMANIRRILQLLCLIMLLSTAAPAAPAEKWSQQKANAWYQKQPWLVGSNYIPATAINELEMWQSDTFDPRQIDKELGWAESLGMNTMRSEEHTSELQSLAYLVCRLLL